MERTKTFKIYKSAIKELDEKGMALVAVNAFGNVDQQKDRSLSGSFDKTIRENIDNIYWYKNHDTNENPGIIKSLFPDERYLMAELKFNLDKEFSRNLYSDYKFFMENGKTLKHSIGVSAIQYKDNKGIRDVSEWKLFEVSSLTKWPANEDTPTLAIKSLEENSFSEYMDELEKYVKWIVEKGLHTDEFIKEFEQKYTGLKAILAPELAVQPAIVAVDKGINYDLIINEFKKRNNGK